MKTMMKNSNLMTRAALTLLMMMLTAATAWADDSGSCGDNVTYYYSESTHALTISGSGAMLNYGSTPPWKSYRADIKAVVIEDGVTSIGDDAFNECSSLTSVSIPNGVTNIGDYAFRKCSSLTSVSIPNSVTNIGDYAFYSCSSLTSVSIPNSVTNIGDYAFYSCSSLESVIINAENPPTLGSAAFANNADGRKIYVPSSSVAAYKERWDRYTNDIFGVFSQDGDTYTIHTATGWDLFCDALQDNDTYNRFSGMTVKLGNNITVTRMASGDGHEFCGTFDGDGHTLTVQYGTAAAPIEQQFVAPFVVTARNSSPVFRNLTIAGNIYVNYTSNVEPGVGGLIGHLFGDVTVEHCTSKVVINSNKDRAGGFVGLCEYAVTFTDCKSSAEITCTGSGGGFVGWSRASAYTIAFEGCLFDGKLLKKDGVGEGNGGFVGWKGNTKTVNINNCLVALDDVKAMATYHSSTFARNNNYPPNITNSYYTTAFGTAQGTQPRSIVAGENVSINHIEPTGSATNYSTSGITAYSGGGIKYDGKFYYGKDDAVSLSLSHDSSIDDLFLGYEAKDSLQNTFALNPAGDNYKLTMPDDNVTISAKVMKVYSLTLPDGMEVVSATPAAIGGKYKEGTTIQFKVKSEDYVLEGDVKNGDTVLGAGDDGIYTVTVGNADITITATVKKAVEPNVTLSDGDYTAKDGDVLTGSTSGTVMIARGACITLSDVTINGGIVCEGTATIILVGENSVTGLDDMAGIQVGDSGTTLTIKGNGALTATGGYAGAGIGTGYVDRSVTLGNITIEGGSITANGGNYGAGIGTGRVWNGTATLGNITIKGGSIMATGSGNGAGIGTGYVYRGSVTLSDIIIEGGSITANGGEEGAGIGTGVVIDGTAELINITIEGGSITATGDKGAGIGTGSVLGDVSATLGTLTIYDDIDLVDATGNRKSGISEDVVYMHGETNVTENASYYFNINDKGEHVVIESEHCYSITLVNDEQHGTVTVSVSAKFGDSVTITVTPDNGYMLDTIEVKDANGNEVSHNDMSFTMPKSDVTITVTWKYVGVKGDVNGDGNVDISDVVALVNIILNSSSDHQAEADVNSDGSIDISDVVALVNIILGQ